MKEIIYEWCPFCDTEAQVTWDIEEQGYLAQCPSCGHRLLLCSECDREPCDYDMDTDLCKHIIEKMWEALADIPLETPEDREEYFAESFALQGASFPAGITRTELWHWFDEHYPEGVAALLYENK